jgi:hypothetical protein
MSRRVVAPVLLLLAAAASLAAVFQVQHIESRGGPLSQPSASTYFSPNGDGVQDEAEIRFTTRQPETVSITIVDSTGATVRHLLRDERIDGPHELTWDGRDDDGSLVDEGSYRIRIRRAGDPRTYSPTRPTVVDVTAPIGRLDRATWQDGQLRGLALLGEHEQLHVLDADGEELGDLLSFHPNPDATSAQPVGPAVPGTKPVRFTVAVDLATDPIATLGIVVVDLAGNRRDLLAGPDAPTIAIDD